MHFLFLGSGGSRKDIETSRNGVSKHRKATRRIDNEDEDDEDTREASRPLMKKKKKVWLYIIMGFRVELMKLKYVEISG